jgi:transcriptional regulator with XRE-family HTH domain
MVTRIRKLLEQKQLTPTQFADVIGVGRPVMSHILSERNKPSLEVVQRIIDAFPEISMSWLLRGTGEMLADATKPTAEAATPPALPDEPRPSVETAPILTAVPPEHTPTTPSVAPAPTKATVAAPIVTPPILTATTSAIEIVTESPVAAVPPVVSTAAVPTPPVPAPVASPATELSAPAAFKPFRAPRFVPPATVVQAGPLVASLAPAAPAAPIGPLATPPAAPAPFVAAAAPVVASQSPTQSAPASTSPEAAMLPFLADSGKAIRRIVIFYRDGSFADYQPEQ